MPRKIKEYGRQDLIDVALPNHASTYTVISHKSVMDLSTKALEDAGFKIVDEKYRATHDGNIASAIYTLNYGDDAELSMMFAWSNSYNKQMRFKCGIGAIHTKNNTTMVCGDMGSWARKHIGTADTETEKTITEQVSLAKMYYDQLVSDKEKMKEISLDRRKQSQLLGILFADHEILTTEQASLIRQQMSRPTHTYENNESLWAFYNYVTLALQQSHPKTWMEDQRVLHWFITSLPYFQTAPRPQVAAPAVKETTNEATVPFVDPRQIDLEDSIAEILAEQETQSDANVAVQEEQDVKMENIIMEEELEEEEQSPVYCEDRIREQIAEDEAAVAAVCDPDPIGDEDHMDGVDELPDVEVTPTIIEDKSADGGLESPFEEDVDFDFAVVDEDDFDESDDADFDFA
jgi:hypothetical protein